jgi:DNA-binding MarR family transcriptional regulator
MYKANLSWSKLQDSFKKLEAKNLIYIETDESTRRRRIRLTESGVIFVATHKATEGPLKQHEEDRPAQGRVSISADRRENQGVGRLARQDA